VTFGDEFAEEEKRQIMGVISFNRANVPKRCTREMG
jgi:hypothetical protein